MYNRRMPQSPTRGVLGAASMPLDGEGTRIEFAAQFGFSGLSFPLAFQAVDRVCDFRESAVSQYKLEGRRLAVGRSGTGRAG